MIITDTIGDMRPELHNEGCSWSARGTEKTRDWFVNMTGGKCPGCGLPLEYITKETEFPDEKPELPPRGGEDTDPNKRRTKPAKSVKRHRVSPQKTSKPGDKPAPKSTPKEERNRPSPKTDD
jgi:hypothetical protein